MNRRSLLQQASVVLTLPLIGKPEPVWAAIGPEDPAWPTAAQWDELNQAVGGRLIKIKPPFGICHDPAETSRCKTLLHDLGNPYALGDEVSLTQNSGWADAWISTPSAYAVAARNAGDVVAAVNFARTHHLRLVVKGGGHSYQGTSNAANSLLIWTRKMDTVMLHDDFVIAGGHAQPQPAVSVGAGAMWVQVYDAVTTQAGRYVQGGGCTTVGVAGLVLSGGFGSFSKTYGVAAAGLLEAEIVTADGQAWIANATTNPDLFWALKGGGGGTFGVVTRMTLRTHPLPALVGRVGCTVQATSDAAYRRLINRFIAFYADSLCNPHWGEQATVRPNNILTISMVFLGLDQSQAEATWHAFFDFIASAPEDFNFVGPRYVLAGPMRHLWDAAFLAQHVPGAAQRDTRPGAPAERMYWTGDAGQVGQFLHGYDFLWLPASLLEVSQQAAFGEGLFAASRHFSVTLHFNKGLAGASTDAVADARKTAMHPSVLSAFALAISAAAGPPAFPGQRGQPPDLEAARRDNAAIAAAMNMLRPLAPNAGSYVSEGNFFDQHWQGSNWGLNYQRLLAVKQDVDPENLFSVHHGVGST